MRILVILIVLVFTTLKSYSGTPDFSKYKHSIFLMECYEMAIIVNFKYSIPVEITMAVAILESGWGSSYAAKERCNYFGMVKGKKVYQNITESFMDFGYLLRSKKRYNKFLNLDPENYKIWCNTLVECGYNNHSDYSEKLIKIIEQYKLDGI